MKRLLLLPLLVLAGCGGTSDRQGVAYRSMVVWETALTKHNYYDACQYEAYNGVMNAKPKDVPKGYTSRRYCAASWNVTAVYIIVHPQPVTVAHRPLNADMLNEARFEYSV